MQHRQVIVLKNEGQWVIRSQNVANETAFKTQEAALKAAVDVAHKLGKDGNPPRSCFATLRALGREFFGRTGKTPIHRPSRPQHPLK